MYTSKVKRCVLLWRCNFNNHNKLRLNSECSLYPPISISPPPTGRLLLHLFCLSVTFTRFQHWTLAEASVLFQKKLDCIIVPLPEPPPVIPQLNTHPGIDCAIKQKQYCTFLCTVCTDSSCGFGGRRGGSEVEKVDKVLRGEGHGATFWIIGCAGMVCVLREETSILNRFFFFCFIF